jgi:hypothetical protein
MPTNPHVNPGPGGAPSAPPAWKKPPAPPAGSGKPAWLKPVSDIDFTTLYLQTSFNRYKANPLQLESIASCIPSESAISRLPGASPQDKVNYLCDFLNEAFLCGLTAWDAIQERHDNGDLRVCTPIMNGVKITDPVKAAHFALGEGGGPSGNMVRLQNGLNEYMTLDVPGNYKSFWSKYGA